MPGPRRFCLCLTLTLAVLPAVAAAWPQATGAKNEVFAGKVVPLAGVLEKQGGKLDADAAPFWLALVTDDGKTYPIIKDDGSRMFFKDRTLLDRPMRLTGRLLPQTGLLQVVAVQSVLKGELHDLYYWCDVCSIRTFEPGACGCCGDPLVRKETPAR